MHKDIDIAGDKDSHPRVMVVDNMAVSSRLLAEIVSRLDAVVVSSDMIVSLEENTWSAGLELSVLKHEDPPRKTSFPRNRQGKDYESVFRRPRGRQRR